MLNEEEEVYLEENNDTPTDLQGKSYQRLKKEATWRSIIIEAHHSNLTREAWCRKHHINRTSFAYWEEHFIQIGEIKTTMAINNNRSRKKFWKLRILDALTSDLSIKEWCKQNNVSDSYFYSWKKSLERTGDIPKGLDEIFKNSCIKRTDKEEIWRPIIKEAHKSNLTRRAWCIKNHISDASFRRWEKYFIQKGEFKNSMTATHKKYRTVVRKRPKKNLWKQRILDAYASDLSIRKWCKQNNVSDSYFYRVKKIFEKTGDVPKNLADTRKQRRKEEEQRRKEEKLSRKYEEITPVFCELPIPEDIDLPEENGAYIAKGTTFRVGKFSLVVEEYISEDMLNTALETLNTVMEVFSNG